MWSKKSGRRAGWIQKQLENPIAGKWTLFLENKLGGETKKKRAKIKSFSSGAIRRSCKDLEESKEASIFLLNRMERTKKSVQDVSRTHNQTDEHVSTCVRFPQFVVPVVRMLIN